MEVFYTKEVATFLRKLPQATSGKVFRGIDLLEKNGENLGMPHVKKLFGDLYELRSRGQQEIRIIFVRSEGKAILLHSFIKKTQKTPKKEMETAQKRRKALT